LHGRPASGWFSLPPRGIIAAFHQWPDAVTQDLHFDQLAPRFGRNIYANLKGQLRLALLQDDLAPWLELAPLQVLDAGGGQGQMAAIWAARGHRVTLVDAAQPMLAEADTLLRHHGVRDRVCLHHQPLQAFLPQAPRYDLVLCHAVLEWTRDPRQLLTLLAERLAPGGRLSLMFYNRHSLVLRNAMGGILHKIQQDKLAGDGRKLTPINPIDPDTLYRWLEDADLSVQSRRGVRCLFDYMPRVTQRAAQFDEIMALERPLRGQQPYVHLARYIHVMANKLGG